jgi:hypothetical protein
MSRRRWTRNNQEAGAKREEEKAKVGRKEVSLDMEPPASKRPLESGL